MFLVMLIGIIALFPIIVYSGFVLMKLWGWFIVPVFHLSPLSLPPAIGLSLIVQYLTYHADIPPRDEFDEDTIYRFMYHLLLSLCIVTCALGIGWVISWFM